MNKDQKTEGREAAIACLNIINGIIAKLTVALENPELESRWVLTSHVEKDGIPLDLIGVSINGRFGYVCDIACNNDELTKAEPFARTLGGGEHRVTLFGENSARMIANGKPSLKATPKSIASILRGRLADAQRHAEQINAALLKG